MRERLRLEHSLSIDTDSENSDGLSFDMNHRPHNFDDYEALLNLDDQIV